MCPYTHTLCDADVGGLVSFVKDWMSLHVQQAPAASQPLFERHHVYPVSSIAQHVLTHKLRSEPMGRL